MVQNLLEITLQNRKLLHGILLKTPLEVLAKVPEGYRNNLWWNIAHVVVTQQLLVYKCSSLPMLVDDGLINRFRKGTVPDGSISDSEIQEVKDLLLTTVEQTAKDYEQGVFNTYNEYTTSTKVTLRNVADAMAFNLYHEGLHLGVILSLRKALAKTA